MLNKAASSIKAKKSLTFRAQTCLGRVFNYKLGSFDDVHEINVCGRSPMSIVENSAQVWSY
jgi:hypothetical protein